MKHCSARDFSLKRETVRREHKPYENVMLQKSCRCPSKTIAVVLRWNVQRGVTVILNPLDKERIEEGHACQVSH